MCARFLFRLLQFALGPAHSVGSDQFVYWLANNPRRSLSPDVFVKLGVADTLFGSWKTWERGGPPDLAVEIISPSEGDGEPWNDKLASYHELGVKELVRYDPEAPEGQRLRAWDRVGEDLVERLIAGEHSPCVTLGLSWTIRAIPAFTGGGSCPALRLLDDAGRLLESEEEAEARGRAEEARGRAEAESRVRELEEQLRRAQRGGG